jgi:hypothetical protein
VNINKGKDKVVHVIYQAPCEENVWESGGIAPHIHLIRKIQQNADYPN